jgi:hypothetical protein
MKHAIAHYQLLNSYKYENHDWLLKGNLETRITIDREGKNGIRGKPLC